MWQLIHGHILTSARKLLLQRNGALSYLLECRNVLSVQWSTFATDHTAVPLRRKRRPDLKHELSKTSITNMEEAENVEDWMAGKITKHDVSDEVEGEEQKRKQRLIKRIIERKYFKQEPEMNVLNWAAKEQIRYLNAEYPDEWTPERLAESFPVSVDGVRRILRSTFAPRTMEEIGSHDRRTSVHQKMLSSGKSRLNEHAIRSALLLKAAAGDTKLPMPQLKLSSADTSAQVVPGTFVSLLPKQIRDPVVCTPNRTRLIAESDSTWDKDRSAVLVKSSVKQRQVATENDYSCDADERTDNDKLEYNWHRTVAGRGSTSGNAGVTGSSDSDDIPVVVKRRSLRRRRGAVTDDSLSSFDREEYAFKGTEKLVASRRDLERQNDVEQKASENEQLMKRTRSDPEIVNTRVQRSPDVRYDDDIYVYDDAKGYQYPYGRHADLPPQNADLSEASSTRTLGKDGMTVHQRGSDYYDDDGEFLFRVP